MFFLAKLRKNDLNSKFILRLRLVFIKNLMSRLYKYCYLSRSFEFSRLSHYLIIKVLSHFIAFQQVSFDILSYDFASVKNFFKFFYFSKINGETGIWTLAPVLPTYSLSRGAPSASWVFLQGLHVNQLKRRRWDSNPRSLSGSPVFKTGSLNHSDTSPVTVFNCDS